MAKFELVMPKMGESIMEATILNWAKKVGDKVSEDETILEIATDKVDSEIPSPVDGVIAEILHEVDEVVEVGKVIAIINTEGEAPESNGHHAPEKEVAAQVQKQESKEKTEPASPASQPQRSPVTSSTIGSGSDTRFYSPLVKNIAKKENINTAELERIPGTGSNGRVTKKDILNYIEHRTEAPSAQPQTGPVRNGQAEKTVSSPAAPKAAPQNYQNGNVEIVEMDRMRKLIADHMVMSKHTSPHVTSFVEADVTNLVNWREKNKGAFAKKYGEKITYTPIFINAVVRAIKDYPMVNISVDGKNLIVIKDINIGMATALPSGNLIVPVIKNADFLNLPGLTKAVNGLAQRARENKLKPEEIQDGTFTITNVGTFGNVMGTPIINQPQVAIMATGAIRKKPAVLETEHGDVIAIRRMMYLSLSYDHRVVDGFLGGSFLRRVADYLEAFDPEHEI